MRTMKPVAHSMKRVIAFALAAGCAGASAFASPPTGSVTPTTYSTAIYDHEELYNNDRIKLQTKDATAIREQKLDFAPGSSTGWHHHPGIVLVTVASGTLTVVDGNCATKDYGPGSSNGQVFVESDDHAHEARTSGGAVAYVTYLVPGDGTPIFRVEEPIPFCAQQH